MLVCCFDFVYLFSYAGGALCVQVTKHPDGDVIEHYKEPRAFPDYGFKPERMFVMKECKPSGIIVVTDVEGEMEGVPVEDQKKAEAAEAAAE